MTYTYTTEFARSIWQPFEADSRIGKLLCDPLSRRRQWMKDPANWLSEAGVRFSQEGMNSLWGMIETQKRHIQALFMVETGMARSQFEAERMIVQTERDEEKEEAQARMEPLL